MEPLAWATWVWTGRLAWQVWHVGKSLVRVQEVVGQQAEGVGVVTECRGQGARAAVHHAGIHEGSDGVELLAVAQRQHLAAGG